MKYKLTLQDVENINKASEIIEKAKKGGWEKLKGPIAWVGKVGFNTCVAHLSDKTGISNAKALCGALKREARKRGELAPEHMGRLEKKEIHKARIQGAKDIKPRKKRMTSASDIAHQRTHKEVRTAIAEKYGKDWYKLPIGHETRQTAKNEFEKLYEEKYPGHLENVKKEGKWTIAK